MRPLSSAATSSTLRHGHVLIKGTTSATVARGVLDLDRRSMRGLTVPAELAVVMVNHIYDMGYPYAHQGAFPVEPPSSPGVLTLRDTLYCHIVWERALLSSA